MLRRSRPLPPVHRDRFDRLLIAQAARPDLTILAADPAVAQYEVSTLLIERGS
jgi:PIN domain nuclease of toxin-antitoxin system